jgi:hypothetical protein
MDIMTNDLAQVGADALYNALTGVYPDPRDALKHLCVRFAEEVLGQETLTKEAHRAFWRLPPASPPQTPLELDPPPVDDGEWVKTGVSND